MHRRPSQDAPPAGGLDRFNALPEEEARRALLTCCSSPRWAQRLAAGRPYGSPAELYEAADRALDDLTDADLDDALDGHPRIGERRDGDAASAREQSAVGRADAATRRAIATGNERYEQRFGQVYLVAAAGRSAEDLLDDLHRRLTNDSETERAVLRRELAAINRSRLARLVEEGT
ncbi:2-oxo-4-hydroxy-4-carboxy-5-ureidoimidazoline decarboxylase [Pseudonocardia bannensis]|uniref:2-oxo-4-hydroxy-4-carboxy-5-ureidoimidazoline decarboxylase n=1 Tax=Pseudonocardia bannensis TaxID=630973 RepID=A0A848DDV7_9PSEU|nr:2-oxo-4-hydroxy-4-carboxy-5-ureidoimidazoline decarboxylase [Pseudonocardia bannensis]NMH90753.1 2-oxo-4-hydroxy-4-carboxy-5-ureidoimidazoline decarboxylase [Pseudonocardia bannensis]